VSREHAVVPLEPSFSGLRRRKKKGRDEEEGLGCVWN